MSTQYPYHPISGHRLVRTINTTVVFNTARIVKVDGNEIVEDIHSPDFDPANVVSAQINGTPFVATMGGDTCLLTEAIWADLEVDQLESFAAVTSATELPSLNDVLGDLVTIGEAAQWVLSNWETRNLASAVSGLEGALWTSPLLCNHLGLEDDD